MVMVVPINRHIYETQYISKEDWYDFCESVDIGIVWYLEFQDHDGDDDGYDAITKCFKTIFVHREEWVVILILEIILFM